MVGEGERKRGRERGREKGREKGREGEGERGSEREILELEKLRRSEQWSQPGGNTMIKNTLNLPQNMPLIVP